jgi:hypothetical protein
MLDRPLNALMRKKWNKKVELGIGAGSSALGNKQEQYVGSESDLF